MQYTDNTTETDTEGGTDPVQIPSVFLQNNPALGTDSMALSYNKTHTKLKCNSAGNDTAAVSFPAFLVSGKRAEISFINFIASHIFCGNSHGIKPQVSGSLHAFADTLPERTFGR